MKPFDLEKALAGARVVTRDGEPVTELTRFLSVSKNEAPLCGVLCGVLKGAIASWYADGKFVSAAGEDSNDLFMASVHCEGWVNLYKDVGGVLRGTGHVFPTREIAESQARAETIACVKIEWEE